MLVERQFGRLSLKFGTRLELFLFCVCFSIGEELNSNDLDIG